MMSLPKRSLSEPGTAVPLSRLGRRTTLLSGNHRRLPARTLSSFLQANKRAARAIKPCFPRPSDSDLLEKYDHTVAVTAKRIPIPVIADIGGGKTCSFVHLLDDRAGFRIVAVDISMDELEHNLQVDDKRVADVTEHLPFEDGEVGLVASRTVVEHLLDVDAFIGHSGRVLASGGYAVHLIPGRYSMFAIAGRLIPFSVAKRILHFLRPEMKGIMEFPPYYDRCNPKALRAALERHGFTDIEMEVSYSQADYFDALLPAFLVCGLYERIVSWLNLTELAAYSLVVARKG